MSFEGTSIADHMLDQLPLRKNKSFHPLPHECKSITHFICIIELGLENIIITNETEIRNTNMFYTHHLYLKIVKLKHVDSIGTKNSLKKPKHAGELLVFKQYLEVSFVSGGNG